MPSRSPSLEELKAEEEHLRLALDAGEIGTWEWDLASDRMKWSAQMFRNLGLAPGGGDDLFHALIDASSVKYATVIPRPSAPRTLSAPRQPGCSSANSSIACAIFS